MKNIVYLNNYMLEDIIEIRNNKNIFSQPANNKIKAIRNSLEANGAKVQILSSGLVNNRTFRIYKKFNSNKDKNLIYSSIIDIPLINTLSSIISLYLLIKKKNKEEKIDNIIFYNYKPEVAWAAWLAKKRLGIKITVEYEDGYNSVEGISKLKRWLFSYTEKKVSKVIDSAILVTSKLKDKFDVKNVVVRGVVDEKFLNKCKNEKKLKDKITIAYSGGLDKERGIEVFLNSLKYIEEDVEIIISGKGPLEYKVKECKDDRVKFLGFVDYSVVQEILMNSHILVNCQLENHDFGLVSFPSKIFEYIATGNRIVSSKCSDIEYFAKNCFYFYDNDDSKNLSEAIKIAISDIRDNNNRYYKNISDLCKNNNLKEIGKKIIKILE